MHLAIADLTSDVTAAATMSNSQQTFPVSGDRSRPMGNSRASTLDLRLVAQMHASSRAGKATSNEVSAPIDGSGFSSSVGDDDGNGNDVSAMHRS